MKVLVTGGCGFLGSHVCELFKEKGWDVVAYDNMTKFEYNRAGFKDEVRDYNLKYLESIDVLVIVDDVRNLKMLQKAINGSNLVAHCAAQPAMTIAIENPRLDFDVNVQGILNVLDVCRDKKIPVANCSTIHVYGNALNKHLSDANKSHFRYKYGKAIGEDSVPLLMGSLSPLHASKRAAELYVQAYADTYKLPTANFRLTGIYGPRQFGGEDHGWVANFTIRTLLGQLIKIFGTDKQVRDILYVKDAAMAFWNWYKRGCPSGTYNIGGGEKTAISIREVLDYLATETGKISDVEMLPKRHGDLWWFVSDCTKAEKAFGWQPFIMPDVGLSILIDWIQQERSLFQ